MKIAIPTRGNMVDDHFGHCEQYTVYTLSDENKVLKSETLPSPAGCGCKSDIAAILRQSGVTVMLAGNMGMGALNILNMNGIDVYRGCSGNVDELVGLFLDGRIYDSGEGCHQHAGNAQGHDCPH
jgi:predicted Fe-Mo cluster-binding NifX family protein